MIASKELGSKWSDYNVFTRECILRCRRMETLKLPDVDVLSVLSVCGSRLF